MKYLIPIALCLVGCAQTQDYSMLSAASSEEVKQTSEYPAVVLVGMPGGYGMCTGTIVSPRGVVTAAHCTLSPGNYRIYTTEGWFITSVRRNLGTGDVNDTSDLSMLIFDEDIAEPDQGAVMGIGSRRPERGEEVRLVGFGCNDLNTKQGSGVKRTGTNNLYRVTDYLELVSTPTEKLRQSFASTRILGSENQAGACFGDSGGPMLQIQDDVWKLVGVTHAGGWDDNMIRSEFIDLNRSANIGFLRQMDQQYALHIFDGCWNESDPEGCGASAASFSMLAFFKGLFLQVMSWFW